VLPFSKRPSPRAQDQWLESGDLDVVQAAPPPRVGHAADPYGAANLPTAVFARRASVTPCGLTAPPPAPPHYRANYVVPPPPHSLAPVAMASSSFATATGTHRGHAITTSPSRRPSLSLGVMIALTGALLGGVLGLGLDAKRQEARAAAASAAYADAPAVVAAAAPPQAPAAIAIVANPSPAARAVSPSVAPVAINPVVPSVMVPSVVVPSAAAPSAANAKTTNAPAAKGDKRSLAPKVQPPSRQPSFASAKAPRPQAPEASEPVAKVQPPAKAAKPDASVKADKSDNGDAQTKASQQLLDQANKDTANTL
jgi:hypothetical protein